MEEFSRIKRLPEAFGFGITCKHVNVQCTLAYAETSAALYQ